MWERCVTLHTVTVLQIDAWYDILYRSGQYEQAIRTSAIILNGAGLNTSSTVGIHQDEPLDRRLVYSWEIIRI